MYLKIKFVFLFIILFNFLPALAQCGNCRPNSFSLFYNYLVPNQIKTYTSPIIRTQQVVRTVQNPKTLLSPCNPVNRYIPYFSMQSAPRVYQNNFPTVNENAYVSRFNPTDSSNESYFDESSNSYVWVLPEGK